MIAINMTSGILLEYTKGHNSFERRDSEPSENLKFFVLA